MQCGGATKESAETKRGDRGEDVTNCLMLD